MRYEPNREELSKFYDVEKLDAISKEIALAALIDLGMKILSNVFEVMKLGASREFSKEAAEKRYKDLMEYCITEIINQLNLNGEQAINFSKGFGLRK